MKRMLYTCECDDVIAEIMSRSLTSGEKLKTVVHTDVLDVLGQLSVNDSLICEVYVDNAMLFVYTVYGVDTSGKTDMFKYYETQSREQFVEHVIRVASII